MSSNLKEFLKNGRTAHAVGTSTGGQTPRTVVNGAIVAEDKGIDNYCLVELFYENGEAKIKYATDSTSAENTLLTITLEEVLDMYGEQFSDFFNGKGEKATAAYLPQGYPFETSAFVSPENAAKGDLVVWNATERKFAVKATVSATDAKVFQVIGVESDEQYSINGTTLVELAVVR